MLLDARSSPGIVERCCSQLRALSQSMRTARKKIWLVLGRHNSHLATSRCSHKPLTDHGGDNSAKHSLTHSLTHTHSLTQTREFKEGVPPS
jgi:hypothetical protein